MKGQKPDLRATILCAIFFRWSVNRLLNSSATLFDYNQQNKDTKKPKISKTKLNI